MGGKPQMFEKKPAAGLLKLGLQGGHLFDGTAEPAGLFPKSYSDAEVRGRLDRQSFVIGLAYEAPF